MNMKYQLLLLILLSNIFYTNSINAQDLPFSYTHYPPHTYDVNGEAAGETVDNITAIINKAGISITWEYHPMHGIVNILDRGKRIMCESGRTYTLERSQRWQYIPYILGVLPKDLVVATKENIEKINSHPDILSLVKDDSLYGLLSDGRAYSPVVREALSTEKSWIDKVAYTDEHVLLLVQKKRIHYTIVNVEQLQEAIKTNPSLSELASVQLKGQSDSENLYLVCTKATPTEIMIKLTDAMRQLGYKKGHQFD